MAPIQIDKRKTETPKINPSKYPADKNNRTSPKPTALPFENK